ncbi:SDR family NAD(P)-dependent oxidoreductase [Pseudidiomarina mangrovi]|uniref:SDR family NAD(P)-dependent oxidoreductase n=1 Tax=Pseudidiomarina mangrovi TaxID=2487133 RepID=UPI000FCC4A22|nr:SDR family NAD(P)-dependent oxidoreductase [Pseudidiomarina mangrovi]
MKQQHIALVTGAGRRFGFALAQALLAEGYQVIAHYHTSRDGVDALQQQGAIPMAADLADPQAVQAMITEIKGTYQRLDLLVNNASCFFNNARVDDDLAALQAVFQVHAIAPYLLTHGLTELLQASANGLVVNITDIYVDSPSTNYIAYCAAKAALANLTLAFAKQLAPKVRVNAIQPGPILFLPEHDSAHRQQVLAQTPLQLEGGLQPMIDTVRFLRDNRFMTGESIKVDGGRALNI